MPDNILAEEKIGLYNIKFQEELIRLLFYYDNI